ncbi:hypothetical protein [Polynucleobacter sp.]|jgi:hypothetical protein|uniref:hypothetical protein n=1 Tax=Polynucleobacter sp. TaxID=2029855 RepID=UPI003F69AD5A
MTDLYQELRYANEGLEQMQAPDAGYFEDFDNKQPHELVKYNQDVKAQCEAIDRLERKIARQENDKA